jgi:threonine dehydrogenase-like Zn-dependent dehydrogenase
MRAAVMRGGQLVVDEVADPKPEFGQALVEVKACGICGSDLHFLKFGATMIELGRQMEGFERPDGEDLDLSRDVYMGHEFSAEVLEYGPDTVGVAPGTLVTSIPAMLTMSGVRNLAYSNALPAGYGERMLLSAPMMLEVPNGLDAKRAALTEPMAVGLHGVNKSGIEAREGALVLGCGPVGLAVIAALKLKGVDTIVAADFSPGRRAIATKMGASEVVDPREEPAFEAWRRVAGADTPAVVFEAIGVPGVIGEAMRVAPRGSRITVVGVCMEPDTIVPFYGIGKELELRFALGYDPMEFAGTLRSIAEGEIDVTPMITGTVDLDGLPAAFEELGNPERHCKIIVEP